VGSGEVGTAVGGGSGGSVGWVVGGGSVGRVVGCGGSVGWSVGGCGVFVGAGVGVFLFGLVSPPVDGSLVRVAGVIKFM